MPDIASAVLAAQNAAIQLAAETIWRDAAYAVALQSGSANPGNAEFALEMSVNGVDFVSVMMTDPTNPTILSQQSDVTAANSKTFTVPAGKVWRIRNIFLAYTSTATVGNRQIEARATDGAGNILAKALSSVLQTATLARNYTFGPSLPNDAAFTVDTMTRGFPEILLPAGYKITVLDNANIAAGDTCAVRLVVEELGMVSIIGANKVGVGLVRGAEIIRGRRTDANGGNGVLALTASKLAA